MSSILRMDGSWVVMGLMAQDGVSKYVMLPKKVLKKVCNENNVESYDWIGHVVNIAFVGPWKLGIVPRKLARNRGLLSFSFFLLYENKLYENEGCIVCSRI